MSEELKNNQFNTMDGRDEYRRNYREIFGEKRVEPGKYVWAGGFVPAASIRKEHVERGVTSRIRALDYKIDKMEKETMKREIETVKRYRYLP